MSKLAKMVNDHRKLFDPCLICSKAVCECEYAEDDLPFSDVSDECRVEICGGRCGLCDILEGEQE